MRARRRHRSASAAALLLLACACLPGTARGASIVAPAAGPDDFFDGTGIGGVEPGWRVRTGLLASDNMTREAEDGESDVIGVGEFGANWNYVGPRVAAAFNGTIAYRHYLEDTFDDETRANFLAAGDWFIIPDTLDWYVMDRLANAPIDPLGSTNPANVQLINVAETGPRLTLRPGSGNELTLAAARAEIRAEESPIDHSRNSASAGFSRDVSANSTLGLVANGSRVDFDQSADAQDFEQADAHVEFRSRRETLNLSVAAGRSRVELADGFTGESTTGWFRVGSQRTSDSHVHFSVQRRAGDTASAMLRNELLLEQGGSPFVVSGDPFFADTAVLRYTRGWHAHQWFAELAARRIDYFLSPLDQEGQLWRLGVEFALGARLGLSVSAYENDIEYATLDRDDTYGVLQGEVDYRIDRNWSLVGGLRHLRRDSSDPLFTFNETMLTLFLSYSPRALRPQGRGT